ncbi:MAG: hypothetical protein GX654_19780 [Desulfatiglans sp.]|mgnify:CR=1 FL=1|nr:hypothetical protein [Desulfatiglans sp.]
MFVIKIIIDKLKALGSEKPEVKSDLIPFKYSKDIDDSDEKDIELISDVYPSKVDLPFDRGPDTHSLNTWRDSCNTLISGISIPIGMKYIDAQGTVTNRQVEVNKIFRSDDHSRYFSGFCFLRENHRTFREDRIEEIIELDTGEIHPKPHTFFDRYGIFNSIKMEELQIIIHILSYLARADRKFLDDEKQIISNIISQYCTGEQKNLVENYAFNHKVTKNDFINEASKLEYMHEKVIEYICIKAEKLIKIDGKITLKEQELFDLLKGH